MRVPQSWARARVTLALTVVTTAAWAVAAVLGMSRFVAIWAGFIPITVAHPIAGALPFWLTPLSATLVHGGAIHLAFNLLILVFCGRPTETVLGPVAMAVLYVVGAYAAAAGQFLVDPLSDVPMIGASGAISAVLGAYAVLFGRNKVRIANPTLAMWVNALWLMAAWIVLQLIVGIASASFDIGVAFAAHIGGFLVGVALANPLLLFRYRKA